MRLLRGLLYAFVIEALLVASVLVVVVMARAADFGHTGGRCPSETLVGTPGDDCLTGGNAPDTIIGKGGDDILGGNHAPDILRGGPGDDRLWGGKGPDTFYCGPGFDRVHNRRSTGADIIGGDCEVVR